MGAEDYDGIDTVFKVCIGYVFGIWLLVGSATMYGQRCWGSIPPISDRCGDAEDEAPDGHRFTCGTMNVVPGIASHGLLFSHALHLIGACLLRIVCTFFAWHPR